MAIDRLPSGRFRGRLMIDGHRSTPTLPTEADAGDWLAGFADDAPARVRFKAALEHRLLPVFGELSLFEVLEADRDERERRVVDGDEGAARDCLQLILEDAAEDLLAGALAAVAQV